MLKLLRQAIDEFDRQYPNYMSLKVIGCVINNRPLILLNSAVVASKSVYVFNNRSNSFMVLDMNPEIADAISNDTEVSDTIVVFKNGNVYDLNELIRQYS